MNTPKRTAIKDWLGLFRPIWLRQLTPAIIKNDVISGILMGVLVIPQSLGYAILAGLPPITGLYASILPTVMYALIGASPRQAVGPVAVTAMMTASSLAGLPENQKVQLASVLALLVGIMLLVFSFLRLGFLTKLLTKGVSSGFVSAAAILIVIGQLKGLLGIPISGSDLSSMFGGLWHAQSFWHKPTAMVGVVALLLLLINKHYAKFWGYLPASQRTLASRLFVLVVLLVSAPLIKHLGLHTPILERLPTLSLPDLTGIFELPWLWLLPKALVIGFVAFASTAAVSDKLSQDEPDIPYNANKELLGLGLANISSAATGGFTVCGGISRTGLNVALGARSSVASLVCAVTILLVLLFASPLLTGLPYAVLSAIIISSVLGMVDLQTLKDSYAHEKNEFISFLVAFFGVCVFGLNTGLLLGVVVALILKKVSTRPSP